MAKRASQEKLAQIMAEQGESSGYGLLDPEEDVVGSLNFAEGAADKYLPGVWLVKQPKRRMIQALQGKKRRRWGPLAPWLLAMAAVNLVSAPFAADAGPATHPTNATVVLAAFAGGLYCSSRRARPSWPTTKSRLLRPASRRRGAALP